MHDPSGANKELLKEIAALKQRVQKLEKSESDYKQKYNALLESEESCRILLSGSPDPLFLISREGQYRYVNRAFAEGIGRPVEEIIGKSISDLFPTDEANKRFAALCQAISTGEKTVIDGHVPHVEGCRYYITTVSPVGDMKGEINSAICSSKDITDRKSIENALQESRELYTKLIDNMPDVMVRMNLDGEILFVNDAGLGLGGYRITELVGQNMLSLIAPEDHDRVVQNTALMYKGRLGPQEYHVLTKDGRKLLLEVNGDLLRHDDGTPYGLLQICRDITERRKVEQEERRNQEVVKRLAEEMAIITEIGRVIGSTLNIDEVYEQFAAQTSKLISFDRIHVNLLDPDGETFTIAYVSGTDIAGRRPKDKVLLAGSMTEVPVRTKRGFVFNPSSEQEIVDRFPNVSSLTTFHAGMNSIMAVPLISGNGVIGILHFRSKTPNAYTERDLLLAERIGSQIAGAIANGQIFKSLIETEAELRNSEEKYRILFNNERVSIYIFDLDTLHFLDANDSSLRLYGYSREEFLGGLRAIDISAEPEKSADSYKIACERGTIFIPLRWHRKKDGTLFPVEIVGGPYTWKGRRVMFGIIQDITKRRQAEEALEETLNQLESRVRERTIELEETNTALRVLLKKGDQDQIKLEENLQSNVNQLVMPFLSKLKASESNPKRMTYMNILEANLINIVSPFINRLSTTYKSFTPKELQIAELIKQGKRSKEIAELIGISVGTVLTHRNKIRKKMKLESKNANLRSHLLSLA